MLAIQEAREFVPASRAKEETWGDDRDQQRDCVQGLLDPCSPVLPPSDVVSVLKDREFLAGLRLDFGAQPLAEPGELAVVVLVVEADITHERRWLSSLHAHPSRDR